MRTLRICSVFMLLIFPVASLAGTVTSLEKASNRAEATLDGGAGTEIVPAGSALSPDVSPVFQVARNDRPETGETASENREVRPGCSWGTFWDVHFGGYRWMWWAAAGGALIAIHAH